MIPSSNFQHFSYDAEEGDTDNAVFLLEMHLYLTQILRNEERKSREVRMGEENNRTRKKNK
jgi:hypothetical protein